ncbi:hypothetical protein J3E73DRAFT_259899 [Bipolaris maydis]|nr:hypothetical protein J3E73DRAFT_259899 [Bipolaris maydis]
MPGPLTGACRLLACHGIHDVVSRRALFLDFSAHEYGRLLAQIMQYLYSLKNRGFPLVALGYGADLFYIVKCNPVQNSYVLDVGVVDDGAGFQVTCCAHNAGLLGGVARLLGLYLFYPGNVGCNDFLFRQLAGIRRGSRTRLVRFVFQVEFVLIACRGDRVQGLGGFLASRQFSTIAIECLDASQGGLLGSLWVDLLESTEESCLMEFRRLVLHVLLGLRGEHTGVMLSHDAPYRGQTAGVHHSKDLLFAKEDEREAPFTTQGEIGSA